MSSTTTRRRGPAPQQHRPRRPIGRGFRAAPARPVRPLQAPFAAVFGVLVAVADGYLGWLVWDADPGWGWYLLPPAVLLLAALAGAALVYRGRALGGRVSGAAVLAWASALPLAGLLVLVVVFLALGGGPAAGEAVLLVGGPLGALVLALQQPVREWTRPHRIARTVGGAR